MDNTAKGFAQKIISELESIRNHLQSPPRRSPANQSSADNQAEKPNSYVAPPKGAIDDSRSQAENPAVNNPRTTYQKNTDGLKELQPWIEAVGLLVLIVYTFYAGCQTSAIRESNRIALRTFNAVNRPYVGVSGIDLSQIEDPANKGAPGARIVAHVKKFGPVPGTNFRIHWAVIVDGQNSPATLPPGFKIPPGLPSAIYPTGTRDLYLIITQEVYQRVLVEHTSLLDLDITLSYDGPSAQYTECGRHHYDSMSNTFMDLGPLCKY